MSLLKVEEVVLDDAGDHVLAHNLDTPRPGLESPFYGLDLRGWVVGRDAPADVVTIRLEHDYRRSVEVDGERPDVAKEFPDRPWAKEGGFFFPVGGLRLGPEFELELEVQFENGVRESLARITGHRASLHTGLEMRIEPIGLTTLGRTGSTAVTRLLAAHPEIVAYRPFEYEPRVVTYWLDLLKELSHPAAFRRQITPNGPLAGHWWARTGGDPPPRIKDDAIQGLLGGDNVVALAELCQSRIDSFYGRVADMFGRPGTTHFVEKLGPPTGALLRELCPRAREIFLVRDFRDMVASIFAFNQKRGFQGFGRDLSTSDVEYVTTQVAASVADFQQAWKVRASGAHLLRYEDLVRRPRKTLAAVFTYLELDASPATIDEMLDTLAAPSSDGHRTTTAEQSVGRWTSDLATDVQEACSAALGTALREFGYE